MTENGKTASSPRLSPQDWGLLLVLAALWGAVFPLSEVALVAFPPLTMTAIRVAIGASTLWLIAFAFGLRTARGWRNWVALTLLGLINVSLPFWLIAYGQTLIEAGLASILNATTPVFAVLAASLALSNERLTALRSLGVLTGLGGAALVIGPASLWDIGGASTIGQLAVLGGALCYGFGAVAARLLSGLAVSPFSIAVGQLTAASAILGLGALILEQPFGDVALARFAALSPDQQLSAWIAVAFQGAASSALAFLIYFRVIASAGAGNGSLVTFLIPPFAILLGAMFLGERLEAEDLLGMAVIGLGLALIDGRLLRRPPR